MTVLLLALFSVGSPVPQPPAASDGQVTFSIKKGFGHVQGRFKVIDYKITLNKDGSGQISGTADVSSVTTGNASRDEHLQGESWFDAARHPKIQVSSKRINRTDKGGYTGSFEIKIKGKTETHEIPFQVENKGTGSILKATFTLSLGAYDIGGGPVNLLVGDKVTVNLNLPF